MKQDMQEFEKEYRQLGIKIGYYRKCRKLSQEQLAALAHLSKSYIAQIEAPNMATQCSLQTIFIIARALNIPVHKLFEPEDIP